MEADESFGGAHFEANDACPRFARGGRGAAEMFADFASFDGNGAAFPGEDHATRAQAASAAASRAAGGGGGDDRTLRERDASLERLLLRGGICFRGLREAGGPCASCDPAERGGGFVPIRIKIVGGAGGESGDGGGAVGDGGGGAVGAKNGEAGPRPGEARGSRGVGEGAGPGWRQRAFH